MGTVLQLARLPAVATARQLPFGEAVDVGFFEHVTHWGVAARALGEGRGPMEQLCIAMALQDYTDVLGDYLQVHGDSARLAPVKLRFDVPGPAAPPTPLAPGNFGVDWNDTGVLPAKPRGSRAVSDAGGSMMPSEFAHLVAIVDEAAGVDACDDSASEGVFSEESDEPKEKHDEDDAAIYLDETKLDDFERKFLLRFNGKWELRGVGSSSASSSSSGPIAPGPADCFGKVRCVLGNSLRADCRCHQGGSPVC